MIDPVQLLQQGSAYGWLYMPSAVVLGALHGLEPGHSKTMMAAFIVAIRGTIGQAVMLGLAATVSHTLVVWLVAMVGMRAGAHWDIGSAEPWFQTLAAAIIMAIALWMLWGTFRRQRARSADHAHHHGDHDDHDHHHHDHDHDDGDAHEREHAGQISRQFANRQVTNGRILLFGLTGGLVPCPASITVLMLCLQLKQVALGAVLVLCFSIGLALTLVLSGVIAALGVRHAAEHWDAFGGFARRAPYLSGALMLLVSLYMGWHGLRSLASA
jgi:ABC-type nickel/cobalt efflux system permease component RcnA